MILSRWTTLPGRQSLMRIVPRRSLYTTPCLWKRDNLTREQARREIEGQKCETYKPSIEDYPGWSEPLASRSEAIVKSERAKPKEKEELQEYTVEYMKHKAKTRRYPMDDSPSETEDTEQQQQQQENELKE